MKTSVALELIKEKFGTFEDYAVQNQHGGFVDGPNPSLEEMFTSADDKDLVVGLNSDGDAITLASCSWGNDGMVCSIGDVNVLLTD